MIEIVAGLDIVLADGMTLRIDGHGHDLDVRVGGDGASIVRLLVGARKTLPLLRAAAELLARAGIVATLYAGSRTVGKIGRDIEASGVAKTLGIPHARLGA